MEKGGGWEGTEGGDCKGIKVVGGGDENEQRRLVFGRRRRRCGLATKSGRRIDRVAPTGPGVVDRSGAVEAAGPNNRFSLPAPGPAKPAL